MKRSQINIRITHITHVHNAPSLQEFALGKSVNLVPVFLILRFFDGVGDWGTKTVFLVGGTNNFFNWKKKNEITDEKVEPVFGAGGV